MPTLARVAAAAVIGVSLRRRRLCFISAVRARPASAGANAVGRPRADPVTVAPTRGWRPRTGDVLPPNGPR